MNKRVLISTLFIAFTYLTGIASEIDPVKLRCEYRKNPLGIENLSPRFSWQLDSNERGQKQSAYQISVASSEAELLSGKADLWDSGRQKSDKSMNNIYDGKQLSSRQECFWRVRVWDKDGKASDWSEVSKFTIGLIAQSDWNGKWIYHKDQDKVYHNWYRKSLTMNENPESAYISIGSFGYHELYVNGKMVTDNILNPAMSFYRDRVLYLTYDIADYLQKGDNVIAVWHGAGWARWNRVREYRNPPFALIADVNITTQKQKIQFGSDASWKSAQSNSSYYGDWDVLGFGGEVVDDTRANADWNKVDYNDSKWSNAIVYKQNTKSSDIKYLPTGTPNRVKIDATPDMNVELTAKLSSQMVEPQVKYEQINPIGVSKLKGGAYLVDMGRNYTGIIEVDLRKGNYRDSVTFEIADHRGPAQSYKQKSVYIFGKSGKGKFVNRFNVGAGRWVTITGLNYQPQLSDIKGYAVTSNRELISKFESSNELLNKIYKVNIDTYLANAMDGILVDCPHRERRGWGEVTVACMYGDALPNFVSGAYMEQYTQFMRDAQFSNGSIRGIVNEMDREFLMWKANNPITILEAYKSLGSKTILEDNYESMTRWFDWLCEHSNYTTGGAIKAGEQGSRAFPGLGDWSTPRGNFFDSSNSANAVHFNNCLYAYMLECAMTIAKELDKDEDVAIYADRLKVQREATHKLSYDAATGKYLGGIQIDQLFPLVSKVTPEEEREKVEAVLIDNLLYEFPYYDTGSSGQSLYTRYFIEEGERMDLVYELLKDDSHPSYGYFLAQDETAWPEHWTSRGSSRIHTCFTGIGGYFIRGFAGIRADEDNLGMKSFIIKPAVVGDLTFVNAEHESIYGNIVVNWKRNSKDADYHIEIPANTTAKVYIPAKGRDGVYIGKKLADKSEYITYLGDEASKAVGNYVVYQVESGVYDFHVSKLPAKPEFPDPIYKGDNLSKIGRINGSSIFVKNSQHPKSEAFKVNDGDIETRWIADGSDNQWLEVEWVKPQKFDRVIINEVGNAIEEYQLQCWKNGEWMTLASGTTVGKELELSFKEVTSSKCRLYIPAANKSVSISEFKICRAQ